MQIISATGGLAMTNCYLVADEQAKQAVLFDAPDHTISPLLEEASKRGWEVIGLWLTHGHFDHLADHALVKQQFAKAKVLIHELDAQKLRQPGSRLFPLPFEIPPAEPDGLLQDGQELKLGSLVCKVIFTPGHSPGHVSFHFPGEQILIGGDLIIGGSIGRTDLPDSDPSAMEASIARVMALPGQTQLLPGHGEPSTLADEGRSNIYVRAAVARASR